jgi:hypothetical protein
VSDSLPSTQRGVRLPSNVGMLLIFFHPLYVLGEGIKGLGLIIVNLKSTAFKRFLGVSL